MALSYTQLPRPWTLDATRVGATQPPQQCEFLPLGGQSNQMLAGPSGVPTQTCVHRSPKVKSPLAFPLAASLPTPGQIKILFWGGRLGSTSHLRQHQLPSQECFIMPFPLGCISSALEQTFLEQCENLILEDVCANGPGTRSMLGSRQARVALRSASLFSIIWGAERRRH